MGRYKNSGIGKGIGTSPQLSLENQEYENKVNELEGKNFILNNEFKNEKYDKDSNENVPFNEISPKGKELLKKCLNEKLKNTIKELYRPGALIGDGGTADAIRHEVVTGELVGGKSHIQKGRERLKNLENILKRKDLNKEDKKIAKELYNDLADVLGVKKYDK